MPSSSFNYAVLALAVVVRGLDCRCCSRSWRWLKTSTLKVRVPGAMCAHAHLRHACTTKNKLRQQVCGVIIEGNSHLPISVGLCP